MLSTTASFAAKAAASQHARERKRGKSMWMDACASTASGRDSKRSSRGSTIKRRNIIQKGRSTHLSQLANKWLEVVLISLVRVEQQRRGRHKRAVDILDDSTDRSVALAHRVASPNMQGAECGREGLQHEVCGHAEVSRPDDVHGCRRDLDLFDRRVVVGELQDEARVAARSRARQVGAYILRSQPQRRHRRQRAVERAHASVAHPHVVIPLPRAAHILAAVVPTFERTAWCVHCKARA